ncbi:MAG: NYN domain-containing protein [Rickettsiales bacterium]|jgi:uncharacterized LabA/DUF88 family protein|nr:NYN domain-containing protein [Rickettsiales bacterium]
MPKQRVIAYIDGFNLFYSCLKGTPYKWLDLVKLCESYLRPDQELVAVKYFTAYISAFNGDLSHVNRQHVYIEALRSISNIDVYLGFFSIKRTKMPKADDFFEAGKIVPVEVAKTEEKGTDVNLAVQLVADAFHDRFDYAMLFSNDSDMAHAVRIAAEDCKRRIGLYIDRKATSFKALHENVCYVGRLTPKILAESQLPDRMILKDGAVIKRPKDW